jgi:hypothetical protein
MIIFSVLFCEIVAKKVEIGITTQYTEEFHEVIKNSGITFVGTTPVLLI